MKTIMTIKNVSTIEELELFLQGNQLDTFSVLVNKIERYNVIQKALIKFRYMTRSKKDKGMSIRYLIKMTKYSRQKITRLIKQYTQIVQIRWTPSLNNGFDKKYQNKDIQLLAQIDERHDTLCGHAVKKMCDRAYHVFGDQDYSCLSELSVSHLYNLRVTDRYKRQRR
jgi:trehalose/maltose hydrolase-like predicted phosphorylase